MALDRHRARILAMQALCQLDAQGDDLLVRIPSFLADSASDARTVSYAQRLIEHAWKNRDASGAEVEARAPRWTVERLTPVDRNVIRAALAEFDLGAVPPKVIINEALEIGREFGSAESAAFINGVLDSIWKAQRGEDEP